MERNILNALRNFSSDSVSSLQNFEQYSPFLTHQLGNLDVQLGFLQFSDAKDLDSMVIT